MQRRETDRDESRRKSGFGGATGLGRLHLANREPQRANLSSVKLPKLAPRQSKVAPVLSSVIVDHSDSEAVPNDLSPKSTMTHGSNSTAIRRGLQSARLRHGVSHDTSRRDLTANDARERPQSARAWRVSRHLDSAEHPIGTVLQGHPKHRRQLSSRNGLGRNSITRGGGMQPPVWHRPHHRLAWSGDGGSLSAEGAGLGATKNGCGRCCRGREHGCGSACCPSWGRVNGLRCGLGRNGRYAKAKISCSEETGYYSSSSEAQGGSHERRVVCGGRLDTDVMLYDYLIDPADRYKAYWDWFVIMLVVYSTVMVPMDIAFTADYMKTTIYRGVDLFVTSVFAIDILVHLNTAIPGKWGDVIFDRRLIFKEYAKGMLIIDLLAVLPFELVLPSDGSFTLSKLLKLPRLLRLRRLMKKLEVIAAANMFRIVGLIAGFFLMAHFMGCIWYFIGDQLAQCAIDPECLPGGIHPRLTTDQIWVTVYIPEFLEGDVPIRHRYSLSLWYALTTMTTVGYGDLTPQNDIERTFASMFLLLAAIMYAVIFGNIAVQIQEFDKTRNRFKSKIEAIQEFFALHSLPKDLRDKATDYLEAFWSMSRGLDHEAVLQELPLTVRSQIMMALHRDLVRSIPLFRLCSDEFVKAIVLRLQPSVCLYGDHVVDSGEPSTALYFVYKGIVEVFKVEFDPSSQQYIELASLLEPGDHFGEAALADNQLDRVSDITAIAGSLCHLYLLTADTFSELTERFPEYRQLTRGRERHRFEAERWRRRLSQTDGDSTLGADGEIRGLGSEERRIQGARERRPSMHDAINTRRSSRHMSFYRRSKGTRVEDDGTDWDSGTNISTARSQSAGVKSKGKRGTSELWGLLRKRWTRVQLALSVFKKPSPAPAPGRRQSFADQVLLASSMTNNTEESAVEVTAMESSAPHGAKLSGGPSKSAAASAGAAMSFVTLAFAHKPLSLQKSQVLADYIGMVVIIMQRTWRFKRSLRPLPPPKRRRKSCPDGSTPVADSLKAFQEMFLTSPSGAPATHNSGGRKEVSWARHDNPSTHPAASPSDMSTRRMARCFSDPNVVVEQNDGGSKLGAELRWRKRVEPGSGQATRTYFARMAHTILLSHMVRRLRMVYSRYEQFRYEVLHPTLASAMQPPFANGYQRQSSRAGQSSMGKSHSGVNQRVTPVRHGSQHSLKAQVSVRAGGGTGTAAYRFPPDQPSSDEDTPQRRQSRGQAGLSVVKHASSSWVDRDRGSGAGTGRRRGSQWAEDRAYEHTVESRRIARSESCDDDDDVMTTSSPVAFASYRIGSTRGAARGRSGSLGLPTIPSGEDSSGAHVQSQLAAIFQLLSRVSQDQAALAAEIAEIRSQDKQASRIRSPTDLGGSAVEPDEAPVSAGSGLSARLHRPRSAGRQTPMPHMVRSLTPDSAHIVAEELELQSSGQAADGLVGRDEGSHQARVRGFDLTQLQALDPELKGMGGDTAGGSATMCQSLLSDARTSERDSSIDRPRTPSTAWSE